MTEPAADYFLEIEARFAERRGTPFIFSSKDWALMKSWSDESVPLSIVLEAIDRCFDKSRESGRKRTISSLSYCRHAVKDLWAERQDLFVGGSEILPEEAPGEILAKLALSLRKVARGNPHLAPALEDAASRTEALRGAAPEIESSLVAVEDRLLSALREAMTESDRVVIDGEMTELLAAAGTLPPKALERTRDANLRRLVRRRFELPRLSLFG